MINIKLLFRFIEDVFRIRYLDAKRLKPLLLAYFITYRCNLKCSYCDYSKNELSHKFNELDTSQSIELLKLCRKTIPSIAFSGGEPLLREDIDEIIKKSKVIGFNPVSLFTNGLLLPQHEEILKYINFLQISLDTLDEKKQDEIFGIKQSGITRQIKEIITFYAGKQDKFNFRMNINAVLSHGQLDDIITIHNFCKRLGIRLTVCPQLSESGQALQYFAGNPIYQSLIDSLIKLKTQDNAVMDTTEFLTHIHDFSYFLCYPYLTPRIYPNGELAGPCPVINGKKYPLLDLGSWEKAYLAMTNDFGDNFKCTQICFLPCYLETSTLMTHPLKSMWELLRLYFSDVRQNIQ